MLALLSSIVLCALAMWLFFGALAAIVYRFLRPTLLVIDPGQASNFLLAWLVLPLFAALLTCYVLYSPDIAQWLVAGHCHVNSCHQHGPQSSLAIIPTAILGMWTLYSVVRCLLRQWLPARRLCARLYRLGDDLGKFVSLGSEEPMAFTLGLLRSRVFISSGMQAACSGRDIECILLHERAHQRRYDNLRLLTGRLLTAPLPRRWPQAALDDLRLCCEKACDLSAAAELSRTDVAAALIRVAKIQQSSSPTASLAFVGNQTEQRIIALLDQPQAPMANELVFATISVTLLVILAMVNPLHQAVELLP